MSKLRMSKKTLNQTNLEALGAAQLAALLMEVSEGSADIKRRLRLELSHSLGAQELSHDLRKRLVSLRKSTSFVGWRKRKALIKDLETQVSMIVDKIAVQDAAAAFDLLWQFIELAPSIYARVDDSRGDVGDVFRAAALHFAEIGPRAMPDPLPLADRVWGAMQDNGFGAWDGILGLLAATLGSKGLERLRSNVQAYADTPLEAGTQDHAAIQFLRQLRGGDSYAADRKADFVKSCLQEIATAAGDTRAYIAQYSAEDLIRKDVAAEVALLWLEAGQPEKALELLECAAQDPGSFGQAAWDMAYGACLTALGRETEAQAHRWACFTANLNPAPLREYLKTLPDFEDIEAEDRAKQLVMAHKDVAAALNFCLNWPDFLTAAQLIYTRVNEINGDHYVLLTPAAEALRARHPLAAVLLWRAMIDAALTQARTTRYGHAAEHLANCAALDAQIVDYAGFVPHVQYRENLQARHERKASFWAKVT